MKGLNGHFYVWTRTGEKVRSKASDYEAILGAIKAAGSRTAPSDTWDCDRKMAGLLVSGLTCRYEFYVASSLLSPAESSGTGSRTPPAWMADSFIARRVQSARPSADDGSLLTR